MSLPASFTGIPGETPIAHFRRLITHLKKVLPAMKDPEQLEMEMQRFVGACRSLVWKDDKIDIHHVSDGEKAAQRVVREFKRYITDVTRNSDVSAQDLIDSLANIESLIQEHKVK